MIKTCGLLFLLITSAASSLSAERPLTTFIPEIFVESIEVKVINLDVVVTDEKGKARTDLKREDFVLYEDGKPVEITNFDVIDEQAPALPAALRVTPDGSPAAEVPKPAKPLHLVVFVDNFNLRPQTRNRVLKQLGGFLERTVKPSDQLMVVTHDLGLQIRKSFQSSLPSLQDLFRGLSRLAARGPLTDSFTRQTLERIQSYGCTSEASVEARSYAQQSYNDTLSTLSALRRTVQSLAGVEGRKAVFYVSDGLPLRPGEDVFAFLAKTCGDTSGNALDVDDVANELREVTTAANTSGVTLFTLEGAGLRGFTSVSVESTNSFQTPTMDFIQNANVQDTLFNLASETGGSAVLNSNELTVHLDSIDRALRTYYSLGYSARQNGDGRIHGLRVEVKRPGLKVQCRKTYRDSTPEERMLAKLDAALWHGIEENPQNVQLEVQPSKPEGRGQFLVPVRVVIPLSSLTLLPSGENFSGRYSLLVSSRDDQGRFAAPQKIDVPIVRTAAEMASGKAVEKDLTLVMRKGLSFVAVALKDEIGGGMAFRQKEVSATGGPRGAQPK